MEFLTVLLLSAIIAPLLILCLILFGVMNVYGERKYLLSSIKKILTKRASEKEAVSKEQERRPETTIKEPVCGSSFLYTNNKNDDETKIIKAFLNENNVKFKEIDTSTIAVAAFLKRDLGVERTPLLVTSKSNRIFAGTASILEGIKTLSE